ncbi:MAG: geranylgeranyl reductase family protein [Thermodesulfobacteriota bacterium]
MHKVAIIGAGISGAYLSHRLAKEGVDTIVFDFRVPHEKLCGGGISYKTMERFPLINELPIPRKEIWKSILISPKETEVTIELEKPLTIINRRDLDYSLTKKAIRFGAHLTKEKVQDFAREGNSWNIFTKKGAYKAEVLVGADGALSGTRRKLNILPVKNDYFFALECFLNERNGFAIFKFFPDINGYLWVFPRVDTLAVGIVSNDYRKTNAKDMEERLLQFLERHYPGRTTKISVRGAYIPIFCPHDSKNITICDDNWALIGDAASFVDPISGEGIYYAIYSAEILARCILDNELALYHSLCMKYFGENLVRALQGYQYFYQAEFIETMIQMAKESPSVRQIISYMISGKLNYLNWKEKFRNELYIIMSDFISSANRTNKKEMIANLIRLLPKDHWSYFGSKIL